MTKDLSGRAGRWTTIVICLVLLLLAVTTRAVALGSFSWPDELTWLQRSAAFMTSLERGDLAGTYLADHPGVVPMWGFGTALVVRALVTGDRAPIDALAAVAREPDTPPAIPSADIPSLLATAALFTVIVTSLAVVAAYLLCIPLLGRTGAFLAGLLLALDPFFLANSRIVHVDGLLASFMLLSVLSLLVYLKRPERRRFLFLSGVMAGLALLTKTPSLFLVPYTLLVLGGQWLLRRFGWLTDAKATVSLWPVSDRATHKPTAGMSRRPAGQPLKELGSVAAAFGLWLATMCATFVVLWPAAWQRPFYHIYRLFRASSWAGTVSHGSNFFLGKAVDDPGPLFYAVVLPFRLSPLVMLLLLAAIVLLVVAWRQHRSDDVMVPLAGFAFILFFTIMVSLAAKKGDRYLLPIYPIADIIAAWALVRLLDLTGFPKPVRSAVESEDLTGPRRDRSVRSILAPAAAAALIVLTSLLWLRLTPYYGAYFNPLLGGGPVAMRTFAFGQGEGLDLAADYLNAQENSGEALAVSFYPQQFRYYFDGEVTSLRRGEWDQTWQFADYVVFYVSQVQRKLPTAGLVDLFATQIPEYTARVGGVDFAQVYRSPVLLSGGPPAVEQRLESAGLGDAFRLAGYALGAESPRPGQELDVTLNWQAQQPPGADYEFELQLVDADGKAVWSQSGPPFDGHFPTSWWRPGRTMYLRYGIPLPSGLAPGQYWLLTAARDLTTSDSLAPYGTVDPRWPDRLVVQPVTIE